ncbi:MAG: hypothetical protein NC356_08650 [Ruminococcus sp.]|nr:hypothetical protein [Ruminococcus sp.]
MKLLDYTGLTRLTSNIKSYIASIVQPIDDRAPYYVKGAILVRGNAFLADNSFKGNFQPNSDYSTNDTGDKRAFLDRMLKGLPSALLFDTASRPSTSYLEHPSTQIPFYLKKGSYTTYTQITAVYESAIGFYPTEYSTAVLTFTIDTSAKQMTVIYELGKETPVYTHLLPLRFAGVRVEADGSITGTSSSKRISADSTGDDLTNYNNLSKGFPPCLYIDMVCSDSKTRPVFLYPTTINGKSRFYAATNFSNGTKSGLNLQIKLIDNDSYITVAVMPTA